MKQQYVNALMFSKRGDEILLIEKQRPDWQKEKLNGIGGKIEPGESPEQAIIREVKEETGIEYNEFNYFCRLEGEDWIVYFYYCFCDIIYSAKAGTDEAIGIFKVSDIPGLPVIDNLRWLIPMALHRDFKGMATIDYKF